jgi:hypothetical protein
MCLFTGCNLILLNYFSCKVLDSVKFSSNLHNTVRPDDQCWFADCLNTVQVPSNYFQVHRRSAERILETCLRNGGLYIKFGQGLVSMNHVLPKEYLDTLKILQNQATSYTQSSFFLGGRTVIRIATIKGNRTGVQHRSYLCLKSCWFKYSIIIDSLFMSVLWIQNDVFSWFRILHEFFL